MGIEKDTAQTRDTNKTQSTGGPSQPDGWPYLSAFDAQHEPLDARSESHLLDAVFDAVVIVDTEQRIALVNRSASELYGIDAQTAIGTPFGVYTQLVWPDAVQRDHAIECVRKNGSWRGEARHVSRQGVELTVDITIGELKDAEDERTGFVAVIRDITERARLEAERLEALEGAEDERLLLRQIIDNIPIAIGFSDPTGKVVDVNAMAEQVWAGQAVKPENVAEYRSYRARRLDNGVPLGPEDWTSLRALRSRTSIFDELLEIERFDGTHGVVRSSAVPVIDEDGELHGVIGMIEDITEAHQRLRLTEALVEIEAIIHSSLDSGQVFESVLSRASRAMPAEAVNILLWEQGRWRISVGVNLPPGLSELHDPADFPFATRSRATGEIVVVNDARADAEGKQALWLDETTSVLTAPLIIREETIGVIVFRRFTREPFAQPHVDFARELASATSLALENARLYEEQTERIALSGALNEIDTLVARTERLEEALHDVLQVASQSVDADTGLVLIAHRGKWLVRAAWGRLESYEGQTLDLRIVSEQLPSMHRDALAIDIDTAEDAVRDQVLLPFGHEAALIVPLLRAELPLGALVLARSQRGEPWGDLKLEFATALGAHLSLAAQTEQLFDHERRRAELSQSLNEIDAIIHSALRFEDVMALSIAKGATSIGADSGSVTIKEDEGWVLRYEHGLGPDFLSYTYPDVEVPFVEQMRIDRQPLSFEYPSDDPETIETGNSVYRFYSVLVAPLVVRGKVFGLIYFNRHEPETPFGPEYIDFARKLSASVSLALENLRLYEEERRSVRFAEALNAVNELLLSTLSVEEMLERIVAQASKAAGADLSVLMRYSADGWAVTSMHEAPDRLRGSRLPLHFSRAVDEAIASGEPVLVEDVYTDDRANTEVAETFGWRSYVLVPLRLGSEPLGVVYFAYRGTQHFRLGDLEFAKRLSTAITLALENARLYQAERQIAETLQETLLVMPHHIRGIDFARLYRSATVTARVGGDFIDAFQLSPHRIALALGDVSGKGLSAASLTAMVRNTLRAHIVDGLQPALVADKTNNVLQLFTTTDTFVTAFFGTLDSHSGRLTYVSAGHPPALIVSANGDVRALTTQSPVLGAFEDVSYREGLAVLEPRDLLFVYSDGLIEAHGSQGLFGDERLADLLSHLGGTEPREVIQSVFQAVESYSEGELRDDIALLAVCREQTDPLFDECGQDELDLAPTRPIRRSDAE